MRVVIAEDAQLLRDGLVHLLAEEGIEVVAAVGDGDAAMQAVASREPHVVILDIRMPPTHTDEGLRAAATIGERWPGVGVLVLSQYVNVEFALELVTGRAGAAGGIGYLLKGRVAGGGALADAVRRVAAGEAVVDVELVDELMRSRRQADPLDRLTQRERDVLALMAEGRSNEAIARVVALAPKTVEAHVGRIFTKLDLEPAPADNRRVLAVLAYLRSRPHA